MLSRRLGARREAEPSVTRRKAAGKAPPPKVTKAELAADNARLRRALARQTRRVEELERRQEPAPAPEAAREQKAASAEILRLITSAPHDAQPVFDAIARYTLRVCDGLHCVVVRYDGDLLHLVAHGNVASERLERLVQIFPRPADRTFPMGLAVLDRRIVHVRDLQASSEQFTGGPKWEAGRQSMIVVPLRRPRRRGGTGPPAWDWRSPAACAG
jgi:hypothetical protein